MRRFLSSSIGVTCAAALSLPLVLTASAAPQAPAAGAESVPGSTQSIPLSRLTRPGSDRAAGPAAAERGSVRRTVRPFSLVGVVWDDPDAELHGSVQVRTRGTGTARWSGWQDVDTHNHEHAPDPDTAERASGRVRGSTAPLWVGDSDGVEVRIRAEAQHHGPDTAGGQVVTGGRAAPGGQTVLGSRAALGGRMQPGGQAALVDKEALNDKESLVDKGAPRGRTAPDGEAAPDAQTPSDAQPRSGAQAPPDAQIPSDTQIPSDAQAPPDGRTSPGGAQTPPDDRALPEGLRLELVDPGAEPPPGGTPAGTSRFGALGPEASAASVANAELTPLGAAEIPALSRRETEERYVGARPGAKPYIGPRPRIITRRGWGADEKLRERGFRYTKRVKAAFVHHTASGNKYRCSQSPSLIRSIYRYHVVSSGWRDIGYNFLVDKCGKIYEGRAGGVARAVMGAHTLGFNANSMGIAVLGSYGSAKPPTKAVRAIASLTAWKLGLYGVNPRGKTYLTSGGGNLYRKGRKVRLNVISGHRDGFVTECPGRRLYGKLGKARSTAAYFQGR
ncbi:N-acetylmuramoyl-L-alanine amidase [Streptomyces poonensis]|nr:peptidoglycan recognition protein [Streptomyces poonensis]